MEAKEKYILDELISGNKVQFIIPVFQRNYVWTEKDCKKLYEDIIQLTHPGECKNQSEVSKAIKYGTQVGYLISF